MSLIPFLYQMDPWWRRGSRSECEMFGLGISPNEIHDLMAPSPRCPMRRFRREPTDLKPAIGKDGFQVCVDVQQFLPSEITVKTVDNNVIIEGKHEEREDHHGYISRHFVRKYALPKGYDTKDVISTLSSDGVLTIKAPLPSKELESNERIVHVQQTGPAHLHVKDNVAEPKEKEQE